MFNREEILGSDLVGCFHCKRVYPPNLIEWWVDEDEHSVGQTALCPFCGIDSVIASISRFPSPDDFLEAMHDHYFKN